MTVRILEWSAWAPGIETRQDWKNVFHGKKALGKGGAPEVSHIAPLLRRRMSGLTRMAIAAAQDCCRRAAVPSSEVRVVFASRHGEMGTTVDLLGQLAAGEAPSPTGFSGSVHHTALGYFSLVTGNRRAMRAVAGGEASFCYGFLDALGLLAERDDSPVLLIAADEMAPAPFAALIGKTNLSYAAAFLMGRSAQPRAGAVSLKMPSGSAGLNPDVPALDFLRWFLGEKKSLQWRLSERNWRWEK